MGVTVQGADRVLVVAIVSWNVFLSVVSGKSGLISRFIYSMAIVYATLYVSLLRLASQPAIQMLMPSPTTDALRCLPHRVPARTRLVPWHRRSLLPRRARGLHARLVLHHLCR